MDEREYWEMQQRKANEKNDEEKTVLLEEIDRLRDVCSQLKLEQSSKQAGCAFDFREFCMKNATKGQVPLSSIMDFLHTYSDGLVPPEERQKRSRASEPRSPKPRPQPTFAKVKAPKKKIDLAEAMKRLIQSGQKRRRAAEDEGAREDTRELLYCP